jgi:hypothetical protein
MGNLEPEIHGADLPAEVVSLRAAADAQAAAEEPYWQPRIDAHVDVYAGIVDVLTDWHRRIADETDLAIRGETRWSAMWEMAGRCLAIARVLLHDLRGGFCSEADGTLRALHEAVQLLFALSSHLEEDAVRRWLSGEWIRPREAREIQERHQAYAIEQMVEAGVDPEGGDIAELGREIYSAMSSSAHHERGGFPESISVALRRFAYGPHPDPERRAAYVSFAGELLEEVLLVVGSAFRDLIGGDYINDVVRPLQQRLEEVRASHSLPE